MKKSLSVLSIMGCIFLMSPLISKAIAPIDDNLLTAIVSIRVEMEGGIVAENIEDSDGTPLVIQDEQALREYLESREELFDESYAEENIQQMLPYLEGYKVQGSGTVFTEDDLILTNAHVIFDVIKSDVSEKITLYYTLDTKSPPICMATGKVLAFNIENDIAVVEPTQDVDNNCESAGEFSGIGEELPYIEFRKEDLFSAEIPDIGESLTVLGYPAMGGDAITVNEGIVSGYLYDDADNPTNITGIKTNADIDPGNSGGATLDDQGNFIGIPSFGAFDFTEGSKLNGIIPLNIINEWMDTLVAEGILAQEEVDMDLNCFPDVKMSHPNAIAICALKESMILKGYPDGTFKPLNTVNRAELLKILVEGIGVLPTNTKFSNCFPDVLTEWFAPYVCFAKEQGFVSGYPDGTFKPGNTVNKVEALKMVLNTYGMPIPEQATKSSFKDVQLDDWFASYVEVANELHLLQESGNFYKPDAGMTRANISEIIYRMLMVIKAKVEAFG